ncbi:nucleotide exchange factor GrpE [Haliea sp. AH-315-K21]|uniref:Protein GrpE n=1 Tax=SAR86 cluster bacterium TaxID=2030880 RepID=A0A2A5CHD4_9GAMM|nr:nucleotide exchange factor GrpE [Haliea sp. AH-315-K21]MBN4076062.1 nucleotide exchange factor GrpE [Gammaproteobacteria bacterium AH-315-E17]PCJ42860.1 MAG: nucleotide exchange factor GrpE [SAR86 cluster bacterium]
MADEETSKKKADSQESDGNNDSVEEVNTSDADGEQGAALDTELQAAIDEAVSLALAEQRDSVLRAHAEVQNMQRRCAADVEKAHKYALEKFSIELLSVMDNMERALQAVADPEEESVKGLCEGIELTSKEFLAVLSKFAIEQIDPQGEPFDPQDHQAISMVENLDVEPNTVITVVQKGYSLNGRVIRPAMVMVSK